MPKFELAKSIEATPLNKRTLIPATDPPVTIPFGAIVDHIEQDRGFDKFSYLGQPYRCAHDLWKAATRARTPEPLPEPACDEPAVMADGGKPGLLWEDLGSNHFAVRRAKVPGGWLISVAGDGVAFYPDPGHAWNGYSLP